jgi:hypothetical protein
VWRPTPVTPALGRLRQEGRQFEASLDYIVKSHHPFSWFELRASCLLGRQCTLPASPVLKKKNERESEGDREEGRKEKSTQFLAYKSQLVLSLALSF